MKIILQLFAAVLLLSSCNTVPELDKSEAARLIADHNKFPKNYGFTIFLDDPIHMDRIRATSLESNGLLTVVPEGESKQRDQHFITLTSRGRQYLMDEKLPSGQQMVRVATAYLNLDRAEIKYLRRPTKNTLEIEYQVHYRDVTPFAVLLQNSFSKPESAKAYLRYQQGKWNLEMEPGPEFSAM